MSLARLLDFTIMELRDKAIGDGMEEGFKHIAISPMASIKYRIMLKEYNGFRVRESWDLAVGEITLTALMEDGQIIHLIKWKNSQAELVNARNHGMRLGEIIEL